VALGGTWLGALSVLRQPRGEWNEGDMTDAIFGGHMCPEAWLMPWFEGHLCPAAWLTPWFGGMCAQGHG